MASLDFSPGREPRHACDGAIPSGPWGGGDDAGTNHYRDDDDAGTNHDRADRDLLRPRIYRAIIPNGSRSLDNFRVLQSPEGRKQNNPGLQSWEREIKCTFIALIIATTRSFFCRASSSQA